MSLFKGRDWWYVNAGADEEYDQGCLCVANIDNSSSGLDKVIVGSYHGFLRIYLPEHCKEGSRPKDVMLETQLQYPILQIEAGRFVSANESIHLAILHPRKLVVYSIGAMTGAVEHGSQYQLNQLYEHNLQRTSYNMTYGPFGGVKGKDFICIQSMDGTVSVFEQESFAFSRFLPGFLIPGPLKYIQRTDSFVTVSSSRQVELYKYQVLAVATDSDAKAESQKISKGKKISMDGSYNLGEQALDIAVVNFVNAPPSILILGERNFFVLKENATLRFMKKLDFNPSCFLPYASINEGNIMTMICTHTKALLVYEDLTLKWAATLEHVPVSIKVGNFQDLKGVTTTLSESGHVNCCYLGTDPSLFVTPAPESREINYNQLDNEMKDLQRAIKEASSKGADVAPTRKEADDLEIVVSVPPNLDNTSQANNVEIEGEDSVPSVTVKITLKSKLALQNVRLSVFSPFPIAVNQDTFTYSMIGDMSSPSQPLVSFFQRGSCIPSSLTAEASATYSTPSGAPRIAQTRFDLPLQLVFRPCLPVKNATHKITIDTNKPPVNLNDIFPELLGENAGGPGNALGFQLFCGPKVTVLASKTSQRYRLQSDVLEAMWLVVKAFIERLNAYHQSIGVSGFKCSFQGAMPLQEFFDIIDMHYELRMNAERYKELLTQRAQQFRAIQRRLLTRFKDKTPAPLQNLDTLLDGTYRQILALAEAIEENRQKLVTCSVSLSASTKIITKLISLAHGLSAKECRVLESALSPNVTVDGQQGWEEATDTAVTHLLRTCLAKTTKDQTINPAPLQLPRETTKLKKHITLIIDRLSKGGKLVIEGMPDEPEIKTKLHIPPRQSSSQIPAQAPLESPRDMGMTPRNKPQAAEPPAAPPPSTIPPVPDKGPLGDLPPLATKSSSSLPPLTNNLSSGLTALASKSSLPELKTRSSGNLPVPDLDELTGSNSGGLRNGMESQETANFYDMAT
ncbi:protein PTHB1-like isoform X2 [Ptychodera flava]|uniref:protein PTHB1-like isoform X2 n=1 Tax=Ptychodera flava TaxID=63121 RepID=UPI003969F967